MDDPTALVADRAAPLVERQIRECYGAIADAAEDETALNRLALVGRHCDEAAVPLFEPVAHELDCLHLPVAVNRDRRTEEQESKRDGLAGDLARREFAQHVDVPPCVRVVFERGRAGSVELELGGIDADVRTPELAHLLELLR